MIFIYLVVAIVGGGGHMYAHTHTCACTHTSACTCGNQGTNFIKLVFSFTLKLGSKDQTQLASVVGEHFITWVLSSALGES